MQENGFLLRYPDDVRSIAIIVLCASAIALPFLRDLQLIWVGLYTPISGVLCFSVLSINHNHTHCPMFRAGALNRLASYIVTCITGHVSAELIATHVVNHHTYIGAVDDWGRPALAGKGSGRRRLLRYLFRMPLSMANGKRSTTAPRLNMKHLNWLKNEGFVRNLWIIFLCTLNWRAFCFFAFPAWALGLSIYMCVNLAQHDGCEPGSEFGHSRNFINQIENWLFCNGGYHTMHHKRPGLHWSQLPSAHAEQVEPVISRELIQGSFFLFILKNYIFARFENKENHHECK